MSNLVTLGRSDAILACSIIELMLQAGNDALVDSEEAENLLQFMKIQLNSVAEEERSPLAHIWKPADLT
jgi:hypothetical protein